MTTTTDIATDLLTPLGAYLRLRDRDGGGGAFLLESVERGRLGRFSFVGGGSRLCTLEEAETGAEPIVGYLAYDHAARLEPTVPLPDDGPDLPESRFVVPDRLLRFDHVPGVAAVLRGDPDEVAELLTVPAGPGRRPDRPRRAGPGGGALRARHASRLGGRGQAARGRLPLRPPPRLLPRRHRLGRAEGAGDAVDLRARGLPPRAVRRGGRLLHSGAWL